MGGGDLNLKKSWHPSTFSNLKKLWEAEQASAKEQQKLEQLRKEKLVERDAEELRKLQEKAGIITQRPERVEWIYSGSSSVGVEGVAEEFLLGRRRFDSGALDSSKTSTALGGEEVREGPLSASSSIGTPKEMQARLREDPLFAIKRKEKEVYQNTMRNPLKSARPRPQDVSAERVAAARPEPAESRQRAAKASRNRSRSPPRHHPKDINKSRSFH